MKRRWLVPLGLIAAVLSLSLLAAACGDNEEGKATPTPAITETATPTPTTEAPAPETGTPTGTPEVSTRANAAEAPGMLQIRLQGWSITFPEGNPIPAVQAGEVT